MSVRKLLFTVVSGCTAAGCPGLGEHASAQVRLFSQSRALASAGGGDKTVDSGGESGGGGNNRPLCPKCGSPCEHVDTLISSTRCTR